MILVHYKDFEFDFNKLAVQVSKTGIMIEMRHRIFPIFSSIKITKKTDRNESSFRYLNYFEFE